MIVRTKKYKLSKKDYKKIALKNVLKQQWWTILIAIAIMSCYFWIPSLHWIVWSIVAYALYILFWLIQLLGVTHLEQGKVLFNRMSYEITSQQILMKINTNQGMPIKWEQIKRALVEKNHFVLFLSKVQIIHLPFKIFNTENEKKFVESILRRKKLIQ